MKNQLRIRFPGAGAGRALSFVTAVVAAWILGPTSVRAVQPVKLNPSLVSGGHVWEFGITPDGSRVIYKADQETHSVAELYSVPAGGGSAVKISGYLVGTDTQTGVHEWSVCPDGKRVVFRAPGDEVGKDELYSVPVGGGTRTKLNGTVQTRVGSFKVAPDGSLVAYVADENASGVFDLHVVPPTGSGTWSPKLNVDLNSGDAISFYEFTPDALRLVYTVYRPSTGVEELYSVPVGGGTSVRLNPSQPSGYYVRRVKISPDGTHVVFMSGQEVYFEESWWEGDLLSASVASGNPVTLASDVGFSSTDGEMYQFTPDGSRVVFRNGQLDWNSDFTYQYYYYQLYSVPVGGGNSVLLCPSANYGGDERGSVGGVVVSPDSGSVYFVSDLDTYNTYELYRVPAVGGERTKLSPPLPAGRSVFSPELTGDGSRVVYLAEQESLGVRELFSVPSEGGLTTKLSGVLGAGQSVDSFVLTPDSSRVVYVVRGADNNGQVFMTPVAGGWPAPVRLDNGAGSVLECRIASDGGHVVYRAEHASVGIYEVFSRPLRAEWTGAGGSWSDWPNWDVGVPDAATDAFIASPASVTVDGRWSPVMARSLRLGGAVSGSSVLELSAGAVLSLPDGLEMQPGGVLAGDGSVDAGGDPLLIPSGAEIRVSDGEKLRIASGMASNEGLVDVVGLDAPARLEFDAPLTNEADTGYIVAHNAVVRFAMGLNNMGSIGVTGESNQIFGDIDNAMTGQIIVSGGATAVFQDDVSNTGVIQVSAAGGVAGTAVFFGSFSGIGTIGAGNVFLEGDTRPGFSPGTMSFGGNVSLGPQSSLEIQIAGTAPGTGYDRIEVADHLDLGGSLAVSFIDGFVPAPGDSFDVWDAGSVSGAFASVSLPALPAGLFWHRDTLNTDGVLSVGLVPESYGEFAAAYGLAGGPEGDEDHDGISNLLEYVQGLDPTWPDAGISTLTLVRDGGDDWLSFAMAAPGGGDLRLELQTSTDMDAWQPLAVRTPDGTWSGPLPVSVESDAPGMARVTLVRPADTGRRFYRLVASLETP